MDEELPDVAKLVRLIKRFLQRSTKHILQEWRIVKDCNYMKMAFGFKTGLPQQLDGDGAIFKYKVLSDGVVTIVLKNVISKYYIYR